MLSNYSQYSPQGLMSQFPGLQGAGWPPGAYSGNAPFGYEPGQAGMGQQQYPFGGHTNPFVNPFLQNPFTQNQFSLSPFAPTPHLPSQLLLSPLAYNPLLSSVAGYAGAHHPVQQIVLVLGQLAQQISVQGAVIQQISIALQQLVQQLAVQGLQSHQGAGLGAGQPLGLGGPFLGGLGGQYFGQNPFASTTGGYGGFSPQAPAWGANRAQTIQ
jgi:hypothetical protein